jgi:hypothetical protein
LPTVVINSFNSNQRIADEIFNEADARRIYGYKSGVKYLTDLASFPPFFTTHFNENGREYYKTKIQICISGPSLLFILIVVYIFVFPLFY